MPGAVPSREEGAVVPSPVTAAEAAALGADDVLGRVGSRTGGLPEDEAARRLATVPFDHERRLVSVLTEDDRGHRMIITKGAPESLLERCTGIPAAARAMLDAEFAAGNRVVAVATREAEGRSSLTPG